MQAEKNKLIQKKIRLPESVMNKIQEFADENKVSFSSVVSMALKSYLENDVNKDNLLLNRINDVEEKIRKIDSESELFYKFIYYMLPFFIADMPEIPAEVYDVKMSWSSDMLKKSVRDFLNYQKEEDLPFMTAIYGSREETVDDDEKTSG